MKEKSVPLIVYGVLLVCLAFVLGYLVGQGNGETQVAVTAAPQEQVQQMQTAPEAETPAAQPEDGPPLQAPTADAPLDINTAEQAELELLPGIGPELANRIITYRQENGAFVAKEQLMDVEGIGEKRYAEIEPLITIGG